MAPDGFRKCSALRFLHRVSQQASNNDENFLRFAREYGGNGTATQWFFESEENQRGTNRSKQTNKKTKMIKENVNNKRGKNGASSYSYSHSNRCAFRFCCCVRPRWLVHFRCHVLPHVLMACVRVCGSQPCICAKLHRYRNFISLKQLKTHITLTV